jgi:hypothetical protein
MQFVSRHVIGVLSQIRVIFFIAPSAGSPDGAAQGGDAASAVSNLAPPRFER